jgi:CheY-like chemotaxis protein
MSTLNDGLITDDIIKEFSNEANEMLDQAEQELNHLAGGADFGRTFNAVFRIFHSVKGGAGMLSLDALHKHMQNLENALSGLKFRNSLKPEEINFFIAGVQAGKQIVAGTPVEFNYDISQAGKIDNASKIKPKQAPVAFVVDDEPEILESLSEILAEGQISTRLFTNPMDAVAEVQKSPPPDVILTDMKMPEMTGLQLLDQVHDFNADIPVIIISGFITTQNLLEAIRSGVFAALEKPFKEDIVLTYAFAAIKQHRTARMFRRGLNLLLYQFSDLEEFLKSHGKDDEVRTARDELQMLLSQWKELSVTTPKNSNNKKGL